MDEEAVRLDVALTRAAAAVRPELGATHPTWRVLPQLAAHAEASHARAQRLTSAPPARVAFWPTVRRAMRARLPSLVDAGVEPADEVKEYRLPLDGDVALVVTIEKLHGFGLGKLFTVDLRLASAAGRAPGEASSRPLSIPRLLGFGDRVRWWYHTQPELEQALEGVLSLVAEALPGLARELAGFLGQDPPAGAGAVTAREALAAALALGDARAARAPLVHVSLARGAGEPGPESRGATGRVDRGGAWMFGIGAIGATSAPALARIPHTGPGEWLRCEVDPFPHNPVGVGHGWMDSDRAAMLARAAAAELPGGDGTVLSAMTCDVGRARALPITPAWRVTMMTPDLRQRDRIVLSLEFDAASGAEVGRRGGGVGAR